MTFYPKRSLRIVVLTLLSLIALMVAGFPWVALALAVFLIGFGVPLAYVFGETELVLRSGLRWQRLRYEAISAMERRATTQPGQIETIWVIEESGRRLRFTPSDPEGFQKVLVERAPRLNLHGEVPSEPKSMDADTP